LKILGVDEPLKNYFKLSNTVQSSDSQLFPTDFTEAKLLISNILKEAINCNEVGFMFLTPQLWIDKNRHSIESLIIFFGMRNLKLLIFN